MPAPDPPPQPEQAEGGWHKRVTDSLRLSIHFYVVILQRLQPRLVRPLSRAQAAVVLYTDAEWSRRDSQEGLPEIYYRDFTIGIGAILFDDTLVLALAAEAPASVLEALPPREASDHPP